MTKDNDTPFLARWARRKQEARHAPAGDTAAQARPIEPVPGSAVTLPSPAPPEPPFDPASLPAIDALTATSDITGFLRKGVPEALTKLALRQVWSLDPQIRDFIEVAENQYNWNVPDGVPGFGPLAEGTDIPELVARATGHFTSAPPPEAATATAPTLARAGNETAALSSADSGGSSPGARQETETEPQDGQSQVAVPIAAARPMPAPTQLPPPQASERPAASHRRRHGGALPRAS